MQNYFSLLRMIMKRKARATRISNILEDNFTAVYVYVNETVENTATKAIQIFYAGAER